MKLRDEDTFKTASGVEVQFCNMADRNVYAEDNDVTAVPLPDGGSYVRWGFDDRLPYDVMRMIGADEVMSGNKLFNVLACYGAGLRYSAKDGAQLPDEAEDFVFRNSLKKFFLEQVTDMKHFYFAVSVIVMSPSGDRIMRLRHKEACYARFSEADASGRIPRVYFADFENGSLLSEDIESVLLLDEDDPLSHLEVLMGRRAGDDGKLAVRTNDRVFAVLCKFPTVGNRYYPVPYYSSLFRGNWYEIKRMIGIGKRTKLKNSCGLRYLVEINEDFWKKLFMKRGVSDREAQARLERQTKEEITNFLSGIENTGKALYSGFYKTPTGEEVSMIKIKPIDTKTEGGDWASDLEEASNVLCFADGVHPNLIGATPGKGGANNSGSDKRELFTLKQSLETAFHDVLLLPHHLVIRYNGWKGVRAEVPMITLTTLDKHKDAQESVLTD